MARPALEPVAPFFRSALQSRLLARLVDRIDEWVAFPELQTGDEPHQSVRLELQRLVDGGIVERDTLQRPHRYRFPADGPLSNSLAELVQRTVGVEPLLRDWLSRLDGVVAASIVGSWASRQMTPDSDVDVLLIVDTGFDVEALNDVARAAEKRTGRAIDAVVFGADEGRQRLAEGSGFLRSVLEAPHLDIVGDLRAAIGGDA